MVRSQVSYWYYLLCITIAIALLSFSSVEAQENNDHSNDIEAAVLNALEEEDEDKDKEEIESDELWGNWLPLTEENQPTLSDLAEEVDEGEIDNEVKKKTSRVLKRDLYPSYSGVIDYTNSADPVQYVILLETPRSLKGEPEGTLKLITLSGKVITSNVDKYNEHRETGYLWTRDVLGNYTIFNKNKDEFYFVGRKELRKYYKAHRVTSRGSGVFKLVGTVLLSAVGSATGGVIALGKCVVYQDKSIEENRQFLDANVDYTMDMISEFWQESLGHVPGMKIPEPVEPLIYYLAKKEAP